MAERRAACLGNSEELADHGERQREREALDEVDDRFRAALLDRIEQVADDLAHVTLERLDSPHRERGRHQSPQARVIGRIDGEHVAGERRPGQAFGDHSPGRRQRGVHVLRDARIVEGGPRFGVTDDQPGFVAIGESDGVDRPEPAHVVEERVGIVGIERAPFRQRLLNVHDVGVLRRAAGLRAITN